MKIFIYILFLFLSFQIIQLAKKDKNVEEDKVELSESYSNQHMKQNEKFLNSVKEYIQEKKWEPEKELNQEEFKTMFNKLIQNSFLKQGNENKLKRFAENTIKKYGEPIIVKNLEKYFELNELRKIYLDLYNSRIITDL